MSVALEGIAKEHIVVDRISWDETFLRYAQTASERSHDSRTKCGCILVRDNQIVSSGFNGHMRDVQEGLVPNLKGNPDPTLSKYSYMIHAEANSIINAARFGQSTTNCIAYITIAPCPLCYQMLWQAGVTEIVIPKGSSNAISLQTDDYKRQMDILHELLDGRLKIREVEHNVRNNIL